MKKFILSQILLISRNEQKAKKVTFNRRRTLILGTNDTGKSSLIKSIYYAFGAKSAKVNPKWGMVNPIILVHFFVDDISYSILRDGSFFAVYDENEILIKKFKGVSDGLSEFIAEMFSFNIQLPNQKGDIITPPPAYLFLPYYIDQDMGWQNPWQSFSNLSQIRNYRKPIVEYHTGLRGFEYYEVKNEIDSLNIELEETNKERKLSKNLLDKVKEKLSHVDFTVNLEDFKDEIKELLVECEKLKKDENALKEKLVELYNLKITITSQMEIARRAIDEARKDYNFAFEMDDEVSCPTCGAGYTNSFAERFELAMSQNQCTDLFAELTKESWELEKVIDKVNKDFNRKNIEIERLEAILEQKKEQVRLRDLIENEGRKELKSIFEESIEQLETSIYEKSKLLSDKNDILKSFDNPKRKKTVKDYYITLMYQYLRALDVQNLTEDSYRDFTKNIKNTGSASTRTLIAYYFSIFHTIKKYSSCTFCPIIIDSPNQQAQVLEHIQAIYNFIISQQPKESQLILGVENTFDIDFECDIIELKEKYSLLQKSEYEEVLAEITPYLDKIWGAGHIQLSLF